MSSGETQTLDRSSTYSEVELDLVVRRHEAIADGVVRVVLADADDQPLPLWSPGAHIDLMLTPSLVRQYSLCGSVRGVAEWSVAVLRAPDSRGGSSHVHDELQVGSTVRVRGPRNHFPLVNSPRYQFIAGGIGITPILTMIEAAEASGADWHLLYGGRERPSMSFLNELRQFGDRVTVWPQNENGMLDLASVLGTPRDDTLVYCCGPEGLLSAVEASAGALDTFEVDCARSGVTLSIGPDDSIYDVAEAAGVDVLASCMEGVCGTCEVPVLEGVPDHRDSMLTETERAACKVMMICVSRSCSERLVLDI